MIITSIALYLVTLAACVVQTKLQRGLPVSPVLGSASRFNIAMAIVIVGLPVLGHFVSPTFTWTGWLTTSWLAPVALAAAALMRVRVLLKMRSTPVA